MESNLTCSICLELYNDPVPLQCMHSFCRDCLIEHLNSKTRPSTRDDTKVQLPCPNCKKTFPLTRNGIRNMQRNFQLQSIVESYKENHRATSGPPCDMCKDNEAAKRCNKCEVSYCSVCLKTYHPPNRIPFSTHNVTDIEGGAPAATGRSHGNAETIKAKLRQDLEDLKGDVDTAKRYVAKLRETKIQVQNKAKELKDGIMIESRKLRDFITKTETEQGGAVTEESKQTLTQIDGQLREHQEYVRKQEDLMDAVRALLKEPDQNAFLRTAPSINTKLQNSKQSKPRTEPSSTDLSQSVDVFHTLKKRVQSLMEEDKHTAPSKPPISPAICICHDTTVAICVPSLNLHGSEATKIDTFGYKYKKPSETDWTEGRSYADQIESEGCVKLESLDSSTPYSISIRAHNPYGWSPWSNVALVRTTGTQESIEAPSETPQPQPTASRGAPKINTSRTAVGTDDVTLHWIADDDNYDAHIVAYSPAVGPERWTYSVAQNCGNSCTIDELSPGQSYLFKVGGCGRNGFTDWSKKVKIGLGQEPTLPLFFQRVQGSSHPQNEDNFSLDYSSAHPCLLLTGMTILHPSNACPSVSDGFTGNSYSVFGNTTFTSGIHYWQVTISGLGSKVRIGIAKPSVAKDKPLGTGNDAWVLVMDARIPLLRQGSHVLHGNTMHKSGGDWIPFTRHIGITLDYISDKVSFALFDGPPSPTTRRTNHIFEFSTPPSLRPVFAIDEKNNGLKLEVKTGIASPMPTGLHSRRDIDEMNRELLEQCAHQ